MARIRTIKPDFFRHLELFNAEKETGMPLRIAFAGLWTSCDKEGRFKWIPEVLKLDSLPFDNLDFSRVIDALWSRGFIEKYTSENKIFGFIPSWKDHQFINNREVESTLPNPYESTILTRGGRVPDASEKLQSGRERKGKERKGKDTSRTFTPPSQIEVENYFIENGYKKEIAIKFYNSYNVSEWIDTKGNKIKNWKQKAQMVWFNDENIDKSLKQLPPKSKLRQPTIEEVNAGITDLQLV